VSGTSDHSLLQFCGFIKNSIFINLIAFQLLFVAIKPTISPHLQTSYHSYNNDDLASIDKLTQELESVPVGI